MAFAHLHCHTEYSLLDGATHIYDMVKRAADLWLRDLLHHRQRTEEAKAKASSHDSFG